jgi:hypothetical protein
MNTENRVDIDRHLKRMRLSAAVFLAVVVAAAAVILLADYRGSSLASPLTVTLVAVAGTLWVGFSATRDAGRRLERIRRSFAVHGDEERLLRDHWLVYLIVGVRLEVMVVAGVLVSLWGLGPRFGGVILLLGGLMIVLTWPTRRKIQILLGRARAFRE